MAERIQHYMSINPKPAPPIEVSSYTYHIYLMLSLWELIVGMLFRKLHDVPSDPVRKAGKCAFASRDITKSEIICEYEGELLTVKEAKAHKESYREEGKVCALMVFESAGRQIA